MIEQFSFRDIHIDKIITHKKTWLIIISDNNETGIDFKKSWACDETFSSVFISFRGRGWWWLSLAYSLTHALLRERNWSEEEVAGDLDYATITWVAASLLLTT